MEYNLAVEAKQETNVERVYWEFHADAAWKGVERVCVDQVSRGELGVKRIV